MRRMGRPGLVGTVARTAVVAGTASAVSGRVSKHQQEKWAGQQEEQYAADQAAYQQQQYEAAQAQAAQQAQIDSAVQQALAAQAAQQQAVAAPAAAPAAAAGGDDAIAQIQKLAALKDQGILTEEEFAAKKAQILGI